MSSLLQAALCGLYYRKGMGALVREEMVSLQSSFHARNGI